MQAIRSGVRILSCKNRPTLSRELDGYFLCLKLLTRVMMAQIIITKVNKSEYVTITPSPFCKVSERMARTALSAPRVSILLSLCLVFKTGLY